jgi:hypothetical protein
MKPISPKSEKIVVPTPKEQRIAPYFYEALLFLKDQIENRGWKRFSANYLREHVRCRFGVGFSNDLSPRLLRIIRQEHPELRRFINIHALKNDAVDDDDDQDELL